MSETTGAPTAPAAPPPAAAPAPTPAIDSGGSPPAISQPPLSLTEAGRLLRQQRRASSAAPAPAAPARRSSANETRAAGAAPPPVAAPGAAAAASSPAAAPSPASATLTPLERALGVPGAVPPEAPATPSADTTAGLEIDGRRYTPAELRDHVLKSTDYTRKTQVLADGQRQLGESQRQLREQAEALAAVLPLIQPEIARLQQTMVAPPQRPDPALLESDPARYLKERAAWESAMEEANRLQSLGQLQARAQARATEQAVAAANEQLAREFDFWADPAQRLAAQQQIVEWATSQGGFSRAELSGLTSPHHLKVMMKAMAFDKWAAQAKTVAPMQIGQPVRGQAPPPAASERVAVANDAFSARPTIKTAAALLAARRANGGAA